MKKFLIVDDEEGIIEEVREFFLEEGFDVYTAETGKNGLELIERVKPDLLMLDIKLPDMLGLDVLKTCKEISPSTKVIVNTGYVDQGLIDEAERLGRDAFLQKPFNLEFLRKEVQRLLS